MTPAATTPRPAQAVARVMRVRGPQRLRAGYDAAETNRLNVRHWATADGLSADAAASPSVRDALRRRSRYEIANNCWAKGMVESIVNDEIGTGPRLQLVSPDRKRNQEIEAIWRRWSMAIGLPEKLRTVRRARMGDGESFGIFVHNPRVDHEIKLDVVLVEADQVCSDLWEKNLKDEVDGIRLDEFGNPVSYRVLLRHPGDPSYSVSQAARYISKEWMCHTYRHDRPGQHRGIPEIAPALSLLPLLRRYSHAEVVAAEMGASIGGVLQSTASAVADDVDQIDPFDELDYEHGTILTMPFGYGFEQMKTEHPAQGYESFCMAILREIARCMQIPLAVAMGDSSKMNYASGRLDHQNYDNSIRIDRSLMEATVLGPILKMFLWEFGMQSGEVILPPHGLPEHLWFWDGRGHVDPLKEAKASLSLVQGGLQTYHEYYAKKGQDADEQFVEMAQERQRLEELGLADLIPGKRQETPRAKPADKDADDGNKD